MNIKYLIPIIILISLLFIPDVFAVSCGDTITQDTVLTNDLIDCPRYGLIIMGDNLTLNCNKHIIDGNDTTGYIGITTNNTLGAKIENCIINNFSYGISLWFSNKGTIIGNDILRSNTAILLQYSGDNIIDNNSLHGNRIGISTESGGNNIVTDNIIFNNSVIGIRVFSTFNKIISNRIYNNYIGILLSNIGFDNIIYNNYIYYNNRNAADVAFFENKWNITKTPGTNIIGGPYLGGNYWSDYPGNDTNGDGIGDTNIPYNTNGRGGGDFLPLVRLPTICIDPGHGGIYPGTTGVDGVTKEKDLNLGIANSLRNILIIKGFNVVMTRETDAELVPPLDPNNITDNDIEKDIQARVKVCKDANSDLMISIHNNANADSSVRGTSTFYFDSTDQDDDVFPNDVPLTNPEISTLRYKLANSFMKNVIETTRTNEFLFDSQSGKTGTIPDWEFYKTYHLSLLRNAYLYDNIMPTTLIEVAFMSNQGDFAMLNNYLFKEAAATGIYNGLVDYFGYPDKRILDSDKDGVINSQDKCPYDSSQGYDSNNDGCKDLVPPSTTQPQPKKIIKIV